MSKKNKKRKTKDIEKYIEMEFYEPIEVSVDEIKGYNKNKFSIFREFQNIKKDLKNNKGKNIKLLWISLCALIVSIGLFVGYFITTKGGVEVKAIICDVVETTTIDGKYVEFYEAKLVYAYKEKRYENILYKDADESMQIGDEVKIRINPKKPKEIYSSKGYLEFALLVLGVSVIMFVGHFYMAWRKIFLEEDEEDKEKSSEG